MKSIIENEKQCFLCGKWLNLEKHHIFGASNRKNSEKYGLTVYLCHNCHNEPPYGVHHNKKTAEMLHKIGQEKFEKHYKNLDFKEIFKVNYL